VCGRISPLGQRFILQWGSNRLACCGAAVLLMWADLDPSMRTGPATPHAARCAALKQLHYVAGDNDRGSYVSGFGENPPKRNHHRNAAVTPWEQRAGNASKCAAAAA
jgi:endoglucanase